MSNRTLTFNPLAMGLLFLGFSLSLWASGKLTGINVFVPWLALVVSVFCGVAIFVRPLQVFLSRRGWRALLPFVSMAFFFGYFISLLDAVAKSSGVLPLVILAVGMAWLIVVFMTMSKGLPSFWQYLITAFFLVPAVAYFLKSQPISGIVLLVFAAGVFSSRWLNIESAIPL